jgi:hypothetical protein
LAPASELPRGDHALLDRTCADWRYRNRFKALIDAETQSMGDLIKKANVKIEQ